MGLEEREMYDRKVQVKRVYVAGLYSHNADGSTANVIDALQNIRAGLVASLSVLRMGLAPFCPWLDYQFGLVDDQSVSKEILLARSIAWLEVSDCVLVISGAGIGTGVDREIARAQALNIPVVFSLAELEEISQCS